MKNLEYLWIGITMGVAYGISFFFLFAWASKVYGW